MKGKILGFTQSTGSGAISAEDGERFTFVAAQWRSDKPIMTGTTVDFAPVAGVATEIYPAAAAMPVAAADLAASPAVQKGRSLAMTTLAFPLAILLLIATFLPVLSSPVKGVSLWGFGGLTRIVAANPLLVDNGKYATDRLAKIAEEEGELRQELITRGLPMPSDAEIANAKTNMFNETIASRFKDLRDEKAKLEQQVSDASWRDTLNTLLVARFLVPLAAVWLIWLAWSGGALRTPSIAAGAVSVAVALMFYIYRGALIGHPAEDSIGAAIAGRMDAMISVGWGTYLIGLCGVGLILSGLGVVKNPLAAKM